ncbi:hypothetical protein GCK32_015511 [Trichostrongylus colubriformis]
MSLSCAFITCAFPVKRKRDKTPFNKEISKSGKSEEVKGEGTKSPHCSATVIGKQVNLRFRVNEGHQLVT